MKRVVILLFFFVVLTSITQNKIPELNRKITDYVNSVIGKQVDRGECWDLAYQALTRNNAKWDKEFKYGKLLNPWKDNVFPGDLIHFKNVRISYQKDQMVYIETMKQHTAIIYRVLGTGIYEIAHQNNKFSGRKVGLSKLDLDTIVKGKVFLYRPVPG